MNSPLARGLGWMAGGAVFGVLIVVMFGDAWSVPIKALVAVGLALALGPFVVVNTRMSEAYGEKAQQAVLRRKRGE